MDDPRPVKAAHESEDEPFMNVTFDEEQLTEIEYASIGYVERELRHCHEIYRAPPIWPVAPRSCT